MPFFIDRSVYPSIKDMVCLLCAKKHPVDEMMTRKNKFINDRVFFPLPPKHLIINEYFNRPPPLLNKV